MMQIRRYMSQNKKPWISRHLSDPYVKAAYECNYRARSAFKLMEIDDKHRILRPGMNVLELGGAPGGWSQVIAERINPRVQMIDINDLPTAPPDGKLRNQIVSVDLLEMDPIPGVHVIRGDFRSIRTQEQIISQVGGKNQFQLVVCDMLPNMTGQSDADHEVAMQLCDEVIQFIPQCLDESSGSFLIKVLQGKRLPEFRNQLQTLFKQVQILKPLASRKQSREMYLLAHFFNQRL